MQSRKVKPIVPEGNTPKARQRKANQTMGQLMHGKAAVTTRKKK